MSHLLVDGIVRGVVVAAVLATFALARKYLPARPVQRPQFPHRDRDQDFSVASKMTGVAMLAIGVVFVWATHSLLVSANHYLAFSDGPNEIHLLPQTAIWWFFPGFGALALSWEITLQLWAFYDRAFLYSQWCNEKNGFDSRRVLRWMALLIAMPIGIATVLAIPMHATIGHKQIRDCGYAFAPCKVYSLADARDITLISGFRDKTGKFTVRAGIVVDFTNGQRWSSAEWGDFKSEVDPALEQLLVRQTGLVLKNADTESDIPLT